MPLLPRFKYSLKLNEVLQDLLSLLFAKMSDKTEVKNFENTLASYFNHKYCITFSSYRMGVYYYLKSLNLPIGSEILLTPITIPDLVNIILLLGLKPKFIDLDIDSHTISQNSLKEEYSENSKCLIITYLSGIVIDGHEIKEFCHRKNIKIIEDISQAYSSLSLNNGFPFFGDIKIGSLSSGKLISTYTGGFALTNDENLKDLLAGHIINNPPPPKSRFFNEIFKNLKIILATSKVVFPLTYIYLRLLWRFSPKGLEGLTKSKFHTRKRKNDIFFDDFPTLRDSIPSGWFTCLCSWQAKVGLRFLKNLDYKTKKRQQLASFFISKLSQSSLKLIPENNFNPNFNVYHFPLKITGDKNKSLKFLFHKGIDSEGYGLNLCNEEKIFGSYNKELPNAFSIKHKHIFLPIHESYSKNDMVYLAKVINSSVSDGALL